jgi:hypothetical protein
LIRRYLDLENRELHALPIILTGPGDATQAPGAALGGHCHVVADQDERPLPPDQCRIGIEVATQDTGEEARLQMRQQPKGRTFLEEGMLDLLALAFLPCCQNRPALASCIRTASFSITWKSCGPSSRRLSIESASRSASGARSSSIRSRARLGQPGRSRSGSPQQDPAPRLPAHLRQSCTSRV